MMEMNDSIMNAIMEALGHVNGDEEGKKGKKMAVTVIDAEPAEEIPMDMEHKMPEDMSDDDYLAKLKGMEPKDEPMELPHDDWSEEDMDSMHGPSIMMQLAALKKKKPEDEEDVGDHEYR